MVELSGESVGVEIQELLQRVLGVLCGLSEPATVGDVCAEQFRSRCLIAMAPFVSHLTLSQPPADANWASSIVELLAAVYNDRDAQRIMFGTGSCELSADQPPAGARADAPRVESLDSQHTELGNTTAERPVSRHVRLEDLHSKLAFLTMTLAQFTWDWRHQPSPGSNINAATIAECAAAATAAMSAVTQRAASALEESLRLHIAVMDELRVLGQVPKSERWVPQTFSVLVPGLCSALSVMPSKSMPEVGRRLVDRACCTLSHTAEAAEAASTIIEQSWVDEYVDIVRIVIDYSLVYVSGPIPRCAFVHVPLAMLLVHAPRAQVTCHHCNNIPAKSVLGAIVTQHDDAYVPCAVAYWMLLITN